MYLMKRTASTILAIGQTKGTSVLVVKTTRFHCD